MKRLTLRSSFTCFVLMVSSLATGGEAEKARFLREYPPASKALQEHTQRIMFQCELNYFSDTAGESKAKYSFQSNNGNFRLDRDLLTINKGSSGFVIGPNGPFVVDRQTGKQDYVIRGLGEGKVSLQKLRSILPPVCASFDDGYGVIASRIRESGFTIEEVNVLPDKPEIFVVRFQSKPSPPFTIGQWQFDSSRQWVLTARNERSQISESKWLEVETQATAEYEGELNGVPILKLLTIQNKDINTAAVRDSANYRIFETCLCDAADNEFMLGAYGVRYQQGPEPDRGWHWVLLAGVIAGLGAVALRVKTGRKGV